MHHEISIMGLFVPSLLVCTILAIGLWLLLDAAMLRSGLWNAFWHPALGRLALFFITLALVSAIYPDF